MPDAGAALRGRTFGIPNLALLAAVAAGIWWFFLRKPAGATTTPQAAAAGSQLESGYGLGFAQGQQAAQANQPPPTGPSPPSGPTPPTQRGTYRARSQPWGSWDTAGGVNVFPSPSNDLPPVGLIPYGTQFTASGPPVSGKSVGVPNGPSSSYWIPYGFGYISGIDAQLLSVGNAGTGGPSPRKHAIGSRSANLYHDAHPLIGAPVKYAHYVRVGGPRSAAAHHANVNRVAQQAGVHPARVAMLNPVPTGLIRIA